MDLAVTPDAPLQQRFAALLEQHQGIVLKVARAWSQGPEDRRDLVQEISIQAWRGFPAFNPDTARFGTWLYRVALNVAISQQRGRELRQRHHAELAPTQLDASLAVADTAEAAALHAQLHALIHALPPLDRALLLLHLDDYSHPQIGEVLGISAGNAATRLHRLRQHLRQHFASPPD